MIDCELIGVMILITVPGLITAGVSLLGLSRLEKAFAAVFVLAVAAHFITVNYFFTVENPPRMRTIHDVYRWLNELGRVEAVADLFWWLGVAAACGFLCAAIHHLWRNRAIILARIRLGQSNTVRHTHWMFDTLQHVHRNAVGTEPKS